MESSQWENWNYLFCYKVSFFTGLHCQFLGVGQGMKQAVYHGKEKKKKKKAFFPFSPFANIRVWGIIF